MIQSVFTFIAALFFLAGSIPYVLSIKSGRTNPHRVSILIFLILGALNVATQFAEGARLSLVFPLTTVLVNVFGFLLMKDSHIGSVTKVDKISFSLSILILIIWYITSSAAIAIVLLVIVNIIAKVLVANKVYHHPYSEPIFSYSMWILGSFFTALSVGSLDYILLLPAFNNVVTLLIIIGIILPRRSVVPKS